MSDAGPHEWTRSRAVALVAGPALGALGWIWWHPSAGGSDLSPAGAAVVGMLIWMSIWWATQAVNLAITGLLPIVVFPLAGVAPTEQVLPPYANDVIFLFAGGCVIAFAIERHGLGERFTSMVLSRVGHAPGRVIAGFMVTTALVSAWVSNTAATAMMLPLAMAAIAWFAAAQPAEGENGPTVDRRPMRQFQQAVLLAVAYGASIGGAMTLLGSPPNPIAAEWIRESGGSMTFAKWASFGVPLGLSMIAASLIAFRILFPCTGLRAPARDAAAFAERAPMTRAAWISLAVFACAAVAWVASPLLAPWTGVRLRDGQIAVAAAVVLLAVPAGRGTAATVVPWSDIGRLPLGVFLLFGGGLALADAMQRTGVSDAIAASLTGLGTLSPPLLILIVVLVLVFASEIASNTALTATAVPIVGAMAAGLGVPAERLVIAAALGASYAFMLPVGTPPNAIVYATGCVPVRSMLRAGLVLNIIAAAMVTVVCLLLV